MIDEENTVVYPAEEEGAVPTQAEAIPQEKWDRALGAWISAHVRSTPVSENAAGWAHLMGVLPRLKEFVENELKQGR